MNTVSRLVSGQDRRTPAATAAPAAIQGRWTGDHDGLCDMSGLRPLLCNLQRPLYAVYHEGQQYFTAQGQASLGKPVAAEGLPLLAWLPPLPVEYLGDLGFCRDHGTRYPYMTGSMANGIASVELVQAAVSGGILASFGAAGLDVSEIDRAVGELKRSLSGRIFGANLIHSPNEKDQEQAVVDLYLQHQLHLVEASAYMNLSLPLAEYRLHGIHEDDQGNIVTPNQIIAKCSRVEVAAKWLAPPVEKFLQQLLASGKLSHAQAELARQIPMSRDITVEADSGGHTDNRPAITLLPTMIALRDQLQRKYGYRQPVRIGLGGGIATPASAAAAFAMGAAYIVTGTINQACRESGSSDIVRQMLAGAEQADVVMAPAVDMFEMGVKLQVLKRGTLFAMRGNRLYELYRSYNSMDEIPAADRQKIEKTIFRAPLEEIWEKTREFFSVRDPSQVQRAETDPKYKMALVFRWYLGLSSRWANSGVADRQADFQIWCGPAMGAFNEWARDSFLAEPQNRDVVTVALNLLHGAALTTRSNHLCQQGIHMDNDTIRAVPRTVEQLNKAMT